MYMANASPNARRPNATYIPLACIESGRLRVGSGKLCFGFLDTNMLVSPMRNGRVGGLNQRDGQNEWFCIAVDYRLIKYNRSGQLRHVIKFRVRKMAKGLLEHHCYCPIFLMWTTKTAVCLQTILHHLYGF